MSTQMNPSDASTPPSTARFLRSLAITLAVAGVIVVTIVMPAEYGADPTGVGQVLGLKQMGEIKQALELEAMYHE